MIAEKKLIQEIEIPTNVSIEVDKELKVSGPKGVVKKILSYPSVQITKEDNRLLIKPKKFTKKEKKIVKTFKAHIKNMIRGVTEPYVYKLKICSSHFPMSVGVKENNLVIKNFMGEKTERTAKILPDVKVKLEGDVIILEGPDRENVGQTATNIEQSTRRVGFDKRVFQDGCYLYEKNGKPC